MLIGIFAAVLVLLPARPASAHPVLVRSEPADGQTLDTAPRRLSMEFSEPVVVSSVRLELRPSTGPARELSADAGHVDVRVSATLPVLGPDTYEVRWDARSSEDGHRLSGSLVFGIQRAVTAHILAARDGPSARDALAAGARILGAASAVGGLFVAALLVPVGRRRRPGPWWERARRRPLTLAAIGGGVATVAVATTAVTGEAWRDPTGAHARRLTEEVALLLVATAGAWLLRGRSPSPRAEAAVLTAAALATVVGALDGHAAVAATPGMLGAIVAHALAASLWTGGVAALVVSAWPLLTDPATRPAGRTLLAAYAPPAVASVVGLAITGPLLAGRQVATAAAASATPYGAVLVVKLALLACAAAFAVRAPRRDAGRRGLFAEAVLLAGVAAVAAVLTVTPPARGPGLDPVTGAPPQQRTMRVADLVVTLAIRPGTPGRNVVTVDVFDTRRPAPGRVTGVAVDVGGTARTAAPVAGVRWGTVVDLPPTERVPVKIVVDRAGLPDSSTALDWATRAGPLADTLVNRPLAPLARTLAWAITAGVTVPAMVLAVVVLARRRRPAGTTSLLLTGTSHPNGNRR